MNSSLLLSIATFVYFTAAVFYVLSIITNKNIFGKVGRYITFTAIFLNLLGFIIRWIESYKMGIGRIPLTNLYESLVFFTLCIAIVYIFLELRYKNYFISAIASNLTFLTIAYASLSTNVNDKISPLIPALKSNWLTIHVITCFLGYAGFAIAFVISVIYIIKKNSPNTDLNSLDEMNYQMVIFGFLFLTIGIITGSVWANSAWGTYWSWDPKETWSLITWFVYAILIHARLIKNWQGTRLAYISIVGFLAVLFTYFGVNYLPGLHSYGAS